jgi:hypothetical protein
MIVGLRVLGMVILMAIVSAFVGWSIVEMW